MAPPTLQKVQTDLSQKSKKLVKMIMDDEYEPVVSGDRWDLRSNGKLLQSASVLAKESVPPSRSGPHLEFQAHISKQTHAGSLYHWFKSVIIQRVESAQNARLQQKDYSRVLATIPWDELQLVHVDSGLDLDTHIKQFDAHTRKRHADKKQIKRFVRPPAQAEPAAKRAKPSITAHLQSMPTLDSLKSMIPKADSSRNDDDTAEIARAESLLDNDADAKLAVGTSDTICHEKEASTTAVAPVDNVKDKLLEIINNQEALIGRMAKLRMRNIHLVDNVNKKDVLLREMESIRSALELDNCALQTCCAQLSRQLVDKDAAIADANCRIKTLQTRNDLMAERLAKRDGEIQLRKMQLKAHLRFFKNVVTKMEELNGPYDCDEEDCAGVVSGDGKV